MAGARGTHTDRDLRDASMSLEQFDRLVAQAQDGDEADRRLTIRQALKHHKVAVAWAMFLSTSLVMEGFDLVTVRL
jgi:SP family general alpha glucoside:H+ symporter-like MFS transporter